MDEHRARLERAERFLDEAKKAAAEGRYRQRWHFMPQAGWMNDPNGLIFFKGEYHLFYQFNPYAPVWGAMHWGHATSPDLVHWNHLPIALAPSEPYDDFERGGCFSGSAVDDGGRLTLIYTGTAESGGSSVQTQCLASSGNGIDFWKYSGNPVIGHFPADGSADFRDPKVWKHDGSWYAVIGSSQDGRGKALLYRSADLKAWEYRGVLAQSDGDLGTMWECPDIFPIGDKYVLMFSPMGLGDRKTVYLVGDLDYGTGKFHRETMGEVDWGCEYYAPQTLADGSGRRIVLGWQNGWDWMPWWRDFGPTREEGWCGSLAMPRTVELEGDGRLAFSPAKELESLRGNRLHLEDFSYGASGRELEAGDGKSFELEVEFDRSGTTAETVGLMLRCSEKHRTLVLLDLKNRELVFDRSASGRQAGGVRRCRAELKGGTVSLRVFVDSCSVEVFTDGGRTVMSNNIYPDDGDTGIRLVCGGGGARVKSLRCWELGPSR
jgi:beta-fructofuranosidase